MILCQSEPLISELGNYRYQRLWKEAKNVIYSLNYISIFIIMVSHSRRGDPFSFSLTVHKLTTNAMTICASVPPSRRHLTSPLSNTQSLIDVYHPNDTFHWQRDTREEVEVGSYKNNNLCRT